MRALERGQALNGVCKTFKLQMREIMLAGQPAPWLDLNVLLWNDWPVGAPPQLPTDFSMLPKVYDTLMDMTDSVKELARCDCGDNGKPGRVVALCQGDGVGGRTAAFNWYATMMQHITHPDGPDQKFHPLRCLMNAYNIVLPHMRDAEMLYVANLVLAQAMLVAVSLPT